MMPAPPKVCPNEVPLVLLPDVVLLPLPPPLVEEVDELSEDPVDEVGVVDGELGNDGFIVGFGDPKGEDVPPLSPLAPLSPLPPLGPMPASALPVARGCPKNPMAIGTLFCPKRTGFQSSLPVIGSIYRLRRKRISLVFTSASALGG